VKLGDTIIGVRHQSPSECFCGCGFTEGLPGRVIELSKHLDVVVASFEVPSYTGRATKQVLRAFSFGEVTSPASS